MKRIIILIFALSTIMLFADDVDFSGYGAVGYKIYDKSVGDYDLPSSYYQAKLQVDVKLDSIVKFQIDLRGYSETEELEFREYSAEVDFFKWANFKLGYVKSPFSIEYSVPRDKIITIDRSMVFESISDLGYGERNVSFTVFAENSVDDEIPLSYDFQIYNNNSGITGISTGIKYAVQDYIFGVNYHFRGMGLFDENFVEEKINSDGFAFNLEMDKKDLDGFIEVFYVQDMERSLANTFDTTGAGVYAFGANLQIDTDIEFESKYINKLEPAIVLGYFAEDVDNMDQHTIQALFGISYFLNDKTRLSINADYRLEKNIERNIYATDKSRILIEFKTRF